MRVLDLFAGLGGWSQPFMDRGHDVFTVDIEPRFKPSLVADIRSVTPETIISAWGGARPDIILASPPCGCFSVITIGRNWKIVGSRRVPKTEEAKAALDLVDKTVALIQALAPKYWILENPVGMLRGSGLLGMLERRTVTYCQYGLRYRKATDLWGVFPPSLNLKPTCSNFDSCHERAPRQQYATEATGTMKVATPERRAKIPYLLAFDICLAAEHDLPLPIAPRGMEAFV